MSRYAPDFVRDPLGAMLGKRRRSSSGGTATQPYPVAAGATNVIQRGSVKHRTGKRVKKKSVEYLYRLQKASTSSCILRFNRMTEYDKNGGTNLGYNLSGNVFSYPVALFDITSCKLFAGGVSISGEPFYRLTSNAAGDFEWTRTSGQEPDGNITGTSFGWWTEMNRGANVVDNTPSFGRNAMLSWSDIRLALYGATAQSTRFTVQMIQFTDECYHPRAVRENPGAPAAATSAVNDQQGRFNAAMEEFVKPLVFHPLHVAGNATDVFKVLESKSYLVQPDININEATASPNVCVKYFKDMNRICKWAWQTTDNKFITASTENKLEPQNGLDINSAYNQFLGGDRKPYVHPNARVYLMITAQAYTRTSSDVAISASNTPSFDIQVRNKWLYDATT